MEKVLTPPERQQAGRARALTFNKANEILWDSAWESLVLAFLVLIFGSLALGLVSGMWRDMIPSPPPMPGGEPRLEAEPSRALDFSFLQRHRFALLFGVLFVGTAAGRLLSYSRHPAQRAATARTRRVLRRISEGWFGMVVVNAFIAFAAVVAVQFAQQFSLTQFLWNILGDLVRAIVRVIAAIFPAGAVSFAEALIAWYKANQFKCMFWLFYTAAICDDLGLPNYKALGRFLWRRLSRRNKAVLNRPERSQVNNSANESRS